MQPKKLNLIVVGPGLIGMQHALRIKQMDACSLVSVVAPDHGQNHAKAQELDVPLFTTLEAALHSVPVDGVVISSPNSFHYQHALICIEHNVPALVEKPICETLYSAESLASIADEKNARILIGHHRTHSPLVKTALSFLNSAAFGKMVAFQGSALFMKPDHYFQDGAWRKEKGGGPVLINLIHEIGLIRSFCGEIEAVQAIASHHTRNFIVEDSVAINFQMKSGALGTFLLSDTAASSKSWEMTSGENPAYPYFPEETCYHFAGTTGSLDFPSMVSKSYANGDEKSWWKPFSINKIPFERTDPLINQLEHFVRMINAEEESKVSAQDGYKNMKVLDAINRSIQEKILISV